MLFHVRTSVELVSLIFFVYTTWLYIMRILHVSYSIRVQIFNNFFGLLLNFTRLI